MRKSLLLNVETFANAHKNTDKIKLHTNKLEMTKYIRRKSCECSICGTNIPHPGFNLLIKGLDYDLNHRKQLVPKSQRKIKRRRIESSQ